MKKFLLPACLIITLASEAQIKEGRIIYERTMQMAIRRFGDPALESQLPKSRTDHYELLFANNQTLWQYLPTSNNEEPGTFNAPGIQVRVGGTNDIVYHNLAQGTRVEQREIMDRNFLVSDSIRSLNWKLTDETKLILDHTARKAISQRIGTRPQITMENGEMKRTMITDTVALIAWFTTDIPVAAAPEVPGQLPGAVLELDVNKGQVVYKAVEISPKVNASKIREPKEGKKVTQTEFLAERDKMMEEMRRNMPAGNRIRMQ